MENYGGEHKGGILNKQEENVGIGRYLYYIVIILQVYTYTNTLNYIS